jgi:hypothetical protein
MVAYGYETYKRNFKKYKILRNYVPDDIAEIIVGYAFQEIISNRTIIETFKFYHFESMIETYISSYIREHYEDRIENHMNWDDFMPLLWQEQENFLDYYAIRPDELNNILHVNTDTSLQSILDNLTIQITTSVERTFKHWIDNWLEGERTPFN